ncbi:hypothetical protein K3495_g1420 [Podosphaera aphanis]|nr:hypothetical protein K3495_g1420 [Podosphaera aphanis]
MASPPYSQSFPPALSPNNVHHSQKRRPSDISLTVPVNKRRKASTTPSALSSTAHPLRQTSFPPEMVAQSPGYSRSPSVDQVSGVPNSVNNNKKKKARKTKRKEGEGAPGPETTAVSASDDIDKSTGKGNNEQNLEEEDEDTSQELVVKPSESSKDDRVKEERRRHLLTRAFNPEQWQRYEAWRSSKLSDSVVRRVVNQTLSQSAPQQVILAVRSVAKIFAGDLIERARKVQTEWLEISGENPGLPGLKVEEGEPRKKEKRRGPLMPDHLREALRRHLLTDQALVGQLGLWQHQQHSGVERFGVKVRGRRLLT